MSLDHLIIKPASEAQTHEAQLRNGAYWGASAGVSIDDYLRLHPILQKGVFARDGKLQYWSVYTISVYQLLLNDYLLEGFLSPKMTPSPLISMHLVKCEFSFTNIIANE
jgi:hypothetical protein